MVWSNSFDVCTCSVLFEKANYSQPFRLITHAVGDGQCKLLLYSIINNAVLTLSKQVVMSTQFKSPACYINDVVKEFLQFSVLENSAHHMDAT